MNETIENIITRRSIRSYDKSKRVEKEKLDKILEAGTYAASGMGAQSPLIVVVQNDKVREELRKMNLKAMGKTGNEDIDPFYGAPTIVIVFADKSIMTYKEDGSLVIGNMMNAAHSLEIDSCWIHRAYEEFESKEGKGLLKNWGIEENKYVGVGHCMLGYRNCEYPDSKPRKQDYIRYV